MTGGPATPRRPRAQQRSFGDPALPAGCRIWPTVALAWLRTRPNVVAPIASARTVEQLEALLPMASLALSEEEAGRLTIASR